MDPLRKQRALELIRMGLADAEKAIHQHPPETVAIYEGARREFLVGQDGVTALPPHLESSGLTLPEARIVFSYLNATAFVSAWYHLHGDKKSRDKMANNAALLTSGTGLDADFAFKALLDSEKLWRSTLKQYGIAGSRAGCLPGFLLAMSAFVTAAR